MTATQAQHVEARATRPPKTSAPHPQAPEDLRRRVFTISLIVLLVGAVGWVTFNLFEGPFANAWYRNRQRALSADFQAAHSHVGLGRAIAIVQVPKLGTNVMVAEGDSPQQLRGGPGHRFHTPLPGDLGNAVISGHSNDWGGPFAHFDTLKKGDPIAVQTIGADSTLRTGYFEVVSVKRTSENDVAPFASTKDFRVTFITGAGGQFSDDRLVVTAVSPVSLDKRPHIDPAVVTTTPAGSTTRNSAVLFAALGLAGALLSYVLLRRRYHIGAVMAVVVPLAALGGLGLLFDLDLLLPPLR
jgi:LPXTG-site transpeptidase (sortase) family protein